MAFYEEIMKRRILNNTNNCTGFLEDDILKKLLIICFDNDSSPGELPQTFKISNVLFSKKQFKKLLKQLGCKVSKIDFIIGGHFNSFKVTLND